MSITQAKQRLDCCDVTMFDDSTLMQTLVFIKFRIVVHDCEYFEMLLKCVLSLFSD